MSPIVTAILVAGNLGLIFLLMTAPLGLRTIKISRTVTADRQRLWQALWPLGSDAGWSGEILSAEQLGEGLVRTTMSWEGRDGQPIERKALLEEVVEGRCFSMRVVEDTALDPSFWADYRETTQLVSVGDGTRVTLSQTDRYRGVAFLVFRYFAMRRELAKLQGWARTGRYRKGGWFEHPLSQVGFAALSALILWPFFGLHRGGLALAAILTSVVALHELGHMAAFRLMGHRKARMIFIPLLGGVAIGGRPYDSRFEVAFVALMGAGFSAFLVPIAISASAFAGAEGHRLAASLLATLAGFAALFNIANLVPVWKFDGGQVLRQICPGPVALALASFFLLSAFLAVGWQAGFSSGFLIVAGAVFSILSLLTVGSGVKPRHELKPIRPVDRVVIAGALLAVFTIHGYGVLWASAQLI
ncbi:site-2 protease family protein [Mesorhizobium sp. M00.F.Ca.ET.186.01.1.1]|nr:site-2 protease family protein [bacterium M00.F.Ca.ET.205.01.1.1]TGU52956.1 site-2 protease family protein [bacterium M00.F.Ca.ET.152.01.1.1]TGV35926.1 site-2 protease family protein [Mesorhizobium sp. M00.F.Ca.ET.186.01.1.1]TGZ43508.1 site-2 protease family protein [bacterium M00.F.Ca.ET.162.01.1.1]TIW60005.1 MAG: site-2 protease family protein [Mesorhizobium sp.]